ncbi:MAG: peptidoglycan-binding protein [Candidatus Sungbacteria bacterium]|uniref:Peptidoglycan-binding protein n=1 Tax=Candidatus Sungiibacteriota bacterium TaxID=2750080 RepID=A0A931SDW9_9BACT|nr:peptidoglycan-binding protein [Candidatus Sungbacteria bacterium]
MTKKLLIVSLMLFGLVVGVVSVSAQNVATSIQPTGSVPLISSGSVDSSAIAEVNLASGTRSVHVKKVQEALKSLGYLASDLETTEYLGPKTKEAITNFQRAQGLPATGFFGPATRAALKKGLQGSGGDRAVIDRNVDIACMKTVVEKRENALLSAYDIYAGKIRAARETRKIDLLAAWSIQDPKERHTAIKAAWDKYSQGTKTATIEWNQSRKTIWAQSYQEAKNCRASAVETQDLEKVEVAE